MRLIFLLCSLAAASFAAEPVVEPLGEPATKVPADPVFLKPPFGRNWGEEPTSLLQWAGEQKLDVRVELPANDGGLEVFTISQPGGGLPGHTADSLEARYYRGRLFEITIFYEFVGQTPDEVRKRFHHMKKLMEGKMGKFRENGRAQNVDDNFLTREESFHFEPSRQVFFLMAYSSVEDLLRKKGEGRFSLIYHNGRLGPPARGAQPAKE